MTTVERTSEIQNEVLICADVSSYVGKMGFIKCAHIYLLFEQITSVEILIVSGHIKQSIYFDSYFPVF